MASVPTQIIATSTTNVNNNVVAPHAATNQPRILSPHHIEMLRHRGISDTTIVASLMWSADAGEISAILGRPWEQPGGGIAVPHFDPAGTMVGASFWPDNPRTDPVLGKIQAEYPTAPSPLLYWALIGGALAKNDPLYLVSTPLEALLLAQYGFSAIAGPGNVVFYDLRMFASRKGIPLANEMSALGVANRTIVLITSQPATNDIDAVLEEVRTCRALIDAGATVKTVRVSGASSVFGCLANYIDDNQGDIGNALRLLLDSAVSADPVQRVNTPGALAEELLKDPIFIGSLVAAPAPVVDSVSGTLNKNQKTRRKTIDGLIKQFRQRAAKVSKLLEFVFEGGRTFHANDEGDLIPVADATVQIDEVVEVVDDDSSTVFVATVTTPSSAARSIDIKPRELNDERSLVATLEERTGNPIRVRPKNERLLIDAIKVSAHSANRRKVYGSTGWLVDSNGRRFFLMPGGSIGFGNVAPEIRSSDAALRTYGFPESPIRPLDAVAALFDLLSAGDTRATIPIVTQMLAGPLKRFLRRRAPFCFVMGPTGVFKTAYIVECRRIYGPGSDVPLMSWTATSNSIERYIHAAKDITVPIDDYKSSMVSAQSIIRTIQSIGDNSSRSRMTRDLKAAPEMPPRGLVLAAGEEIPEGQRSVISRMQLVRLKKGWLTSAKLTKLQQDPRLPFAGRTWIEFINRHWDRFESETESQLIALRDEFVMQLPGSHARTADALAVLLFTVTTLFQFAEEAGFLIKKEEWIGAARDALLHIGRETHLATSEQSPGRRFMDVLGAMIRANEACLRPIHGETTVYGAGLDVGWHQGSEALVEPDTVYVAVEQYLRRSGQAIGVNRDGLCRTLESEGFHQRSEADHITVRRSLGGGKRARVLVLRLDALGFDMLGTNGTAVSGGPVMPTLAQHHGPVLPS